MLLQVSHGFLSDSWTSLLCFYLYLICIHVLPHSDAKWRLNIYTTVVSMFSYVHCSKQHYEAEHITQCLWIDRHTWNTAHCNLASEEQYVALQLTTDRWPLTTDQWATSEEQVWRGVLGPACRGFRHRWCFGGGWLVCHSCRTGLPLLLQVHSKVIIHLCARLVLWQGICNHHTHSLTLHYTGHKSSHTLLQICLLFVVVVVLFLSWIYDDDKQS